jgi:DNA-binding beta-propeller fold protein YncE
VPLAAGARIGPYQVVAPIGAGGMGEVYRVRDDRLGRDVALKILPADFHTDADRLRRFGDEARAAGGLSHPGILAVHDVGEHEGAPYIVSELLEGETLRERLNGDGGRLPPRKALEYGTQIALALAAAHEKGIIHRDLKPENLFILDDGRVKILDFGLAKALGQTMDAATAATMAAGNVTATGAILGTSGYMAPEQVRGAAVDGRSDIFALGSVLYEMLAGTPAFPGASHVERAYAVLKDDPPPLTTEGLPPAIDTIVRRCLEKRPADRFQSARDLAFSLQALASATNTQASGPSLPQPPARRRLGWLVPALVLAALIGAATGLVLGRRRDRPAPAATAAASSPRIQRLVFRHGIIEHARFAPDGRSVVIAASFDGEPLRGYQVVPGRAELRAITGDQADVADVSSGGELALLLGERGRHTRLAVADLAGGAPRELVTDVTEAAYTPDGQKLAIVRVGDSGTRIELPPGKVVFETLATVTNLRMSRKGDVLAFLEYPVRNDDRGHVVVVDLAGGKPRTLGPEWYSARGLAFSPDGREVWVTANSEKLDRALHALDLATGADRIVSAFPGEAVLADVHPDGRALVAIWHSHTRIVGQPPGGDRQLDLAWFDRDELAGLTPDGKLILFYDGGDAGGTNYVTYVRPINGDPAVRIASGKAYALSPDGKWALVAPEPPWAHLTLVPTGAGEPKPQPPGPVTATFDARFTSHAGRWVLMALGPSGPPRLWLQEDGQPPKPFGPDEIGQLFEVSPDDKVVAVRVRNDSLLVPLDGGPARKLEGLGEPDVPISFSGNGKAVVVARRDAGVFAYDLATRKLTKLLDNPAAGASGKISRGFVARDGKGFVYSLRVTSSDLFLVEGLR